MATGGAGDRRHFGLVQRGRGTMPMTPADAATGRADRAEDWGVRLQVWMQRAGRPVLGPEQLEVLEAIDRCRSISAAARALGIPYRRAWELVQGVNEAAGEPLVSTATGGVQGGGAQLTPLGCWAVAGFRRLRENLPQTAAGLVPHLGEPAAAALHVVAAVSLEEVLGQLLTDFAAVEPGVRVRTVFGASDELADHLLAGSPGHLFLTADPLQLDRLAAAGFLLPGTAVALAENGLAVVACSDRACAARRPADLARDDAVRVALAVPDCPLGRYTRAYLAGLNLYERVLRRAVRVENSRAVLAAVRAGQAEVGLVYASDAARAERCRTLFRVRRTPVPIRYSGSVVKAGADPGPARRLLEFLSSAPAARRFRGCGFLPVRQQS
jgi:molybdenum ABC transporter molybdate-binding protein